MNSFFQKLGLVLIVITITLFSFPMLYAQDGLFDSSLDAIKGKLEEEGIEVIDYSEANPWGNLAPDIIELLEDAGFENLGDISREAEYDQAVGNVSALTDTLETVDGLTNDDINRIVNEIRFEGESQLRSVVATIAKVLRNIIGAFAALWIVVSGILMVMAHGDESKITEQKQSITYAIIGLVIVLLLERMIDLIYGVPGVERGLTVEAAQAVDVEILGLVAFIRAVIGAISILMIIVAGFKTITAQGEEEKITNQRKAILWVAVGIVIITINQVVVKNLFIDPARGGDEITQQGVGRVIDLFGTVTQFILGFTGVIAFGALVYGAGTMITNFGNDEAVQSSKKIIRNALIGIMIILSAYALVATVIKF